ncbi:MAG: hypothetical protein RR131_03795 [Anaerovorax sp.]
MPEIKKVKLLIVIVDRGVGEAVSSVLRKMQVTFNLTSPGYGAAGSDLADYLGITSDEKDIVISVVLEEKVQSALDLLLYKFNLDQPGNGVAFTIPITGASGPLALKYMSGLNWKPVK